MNLNVAIYFWQVNTGVTNFFSIVYNLIMKKIFIVSGLMLSVLFFAGCENLNSENNQVNVEVKRMLSKYIAANNNNDIQSLSAIVSDNFRAAELGKNDFVIREIASVKEYDLFTLNSLTRSNKPARQVVADVDFKARVSYTPKIALPIFQGNIPKLKGLLSQRCLLDIVEYKGFAMLASYYNYAWLESYQYGVAPPAVIEFYPAKAKAQAGSELKLYFSLARGRKDTFLSVIINGKIVSGSSLDQSIYSNSHILIVPLTAK